MEAAQERIENYINNNKIVLFMKGTAEQPQCQFSHIAVNILNDIGILEFKDVNVLSDPELRTSIKAYSNWPTIPQLYANGKFVGGSDIMIELADEGELQNILA